MDFDTHRPRFPLRDGGLWWTWAISGFGDISSAIHFCVVAFSFAMVGVGRSRRIPDGRSITLKVIMLAINVEGLLLSPPLAFALCVELTFVYLGRYRSPYWDLFFPPHSHLVVT